MIVHVALVTLVDRESGDKDVIIVGSLLSQDVAMIAATAYADAWKDSKVIQANPFTWETPVGRVINFANDNIHFGE